MPHKQVLPFSWNVKASRQEPSHVTPIQGNQTGCHLGGGLIGVWQGAQQVTRRVGGLLLGVAAHVGSLQCSSLMRP